VSPRLIKKILLVANTTWNIYNFRQNLLRKLISEGHEIVVIAPIDEYIEYKENFPEIEHINLRSLNRDSKNPIRDISLFIEFRKIYLQEKPDLIIHYTHKPNIFGSMAAGVLGFKSISIVTGLGYSFIHKGFINNVTEFLYKSTSKYNEYVIFENSDDRQYFVDKKLVDEPKALAIKSCGVDINYFNDTSNNKFDNGVLKFTFIGRLLKDKGISEFVAAAKYFKKRNKKFKFIVLGDFDQDNPSNIDREDLLQWINNGIIDYKGFVDDVRPYIERSSCVVLPSYREGMPRTMLEAMSMKRAIITTNTAGCRELVHEGKNGYLSEVKNENSLIEAIEKMASHTHEERRKMGDYGRNMIELEMADNLVADKLYSLISSVIFV
jgi:glycosyltransferase involved in cell wall biosynthesis